MSKEYNDRWNKPLVNPPVTYGEWQEKQATEGFKSYLDKTADDFIEDSDNLSLDREAQG